MSNSLGHLPQFVTHRKEVAADGVGVPDVAFLRSRGYEKVVLYIETDVGAHTGKATIEVYLHDVDNDNWISIFTQLAANEYTPYEVDVHGGDIRVALRTFAGGATKVSVFVAGLVPERTFGN